MDLFVAIGIIVAVLVAGFARCAGYGSRHSFTDPPPPPQRPDEDE